MNVITTLNDKRRERQVKYERSVLRDLSINTLKERVKQYFGSTRIASSILMNTGIEEACYDVALEAYLLGAKFSKFGFHGEGIEEVRLRCMREEKHLMDTLYNFLLYWGSGHEGAMSESLFYHCEQYVQVWWREGFEKGQRRHKLRLH
ncbi:YbaK family protein [Neobacillus massiliamazoniensis]|uniref:KINB signaling pathway activation protein n=1 Tax=Neobacillus massiliamazoniensis TaxID=1499688 RepID=A0A0U1P539_9BACI|nr:YbaK family protein [Neobacillus massiliamazoniensis]CRK85316.1 KINB signaling pathway activation protein [Neobacillus massiliamazoniensis]